MAFSSTTVGLLVAGLSIAALIVILKASHVKHEGQQSNLNKPEFLSLGVWKAVGEAVVSPTLSLMHETPFNGGLGVESVATFVNPLSKLEYKDFEAFFTSLFSMLPEFTYKGAPSSSFDHGENPYRRLLAQLEAVMHKPVGYASSPSLPGAINSPW